MFPRSDWNPENVKAADLVRTWKMSELAAAGWIPAQTVAELPAGTIVATSSHGRMRQGYVSKVARTNVYVTLTTPTAVEEVKDPRFASYARENGGPKLVNKPVTAARVYYRPAPDAPTPAPAQPRAARKPAAPAPVFPAGYGPAKVSVLQARASAPVYQVGEPHPHTAGTPRSRCLALIEAPSASGPCFSGCHQVGSHPIHKPPTTANAADTGAALSLASDAAPEPTISCPRNCGVDVREHRSSDLIDGRCDTDATRQSAQRDAWVRDVLAALAAGAGTLRKAEQAVVDAAHEAALTAGPAPVYPAPGSQIPGQPGYVVGQCEHRVAMSEWRVGFRVCERCPAEPDAGDEAEDLTPEEAVDRAYDEECRRAAAGGAR